jgi:hypothetical protein
MANLNSPFGGRPVGSVIGASLSGMVNTYSAAVDYGTDLFIGDPVVVTGARSNGFQNVALATAGATNQLTGFIVGFQPTFRIVQDGYGILNTVRYPIVCDDPAAVFELQEDGLVTPIAAASIGLNVDLVAGTGNAYTKRSGWMINSDTVTSGATLQMIIRDHVPRVGNEEATIYAKYWCTINLHTKRLGALAGIS